MESQYILIAKFRWLDETVLLDKIKSESEPCNERTTMQYDYFVKFSA